jgi:hypothetical protein
MWGGKPVCCLFSFLIPSTFNLLLVKPYFKALGGGHTVMFFSAVLFFDITHEALYNGTVWYLGYWAGQYEDPNRGQPVDVVLCV